MVIRQIYFAFYLNYFTFVIQLTLLRILFQVLFGFNKVIMVIFFYTFASLIKQNANTAYCANNSIQI
jgi:hypothetical protein